jgi:hypothetical protein
MYWCLGIEIAEGKSEIVFINDLSRDFLADDFTEDGVCHTLDRNDLIILRIDSICISIGTLPNLAFPMPQGAE